VAGRASIVGACETSVGKVREHNEDSHFIDVDRGIFAVCDGMGGHAAGEVASALAISVIRDHWSSEVTAQVADNWLDLGTPEARKQLIAAVQDGVVAAHDAIVGEAQRDKSKHGMGTTVVGALVVGGDVVFAHCGDSRAYIVRDAIAMQLTEDHTLLARLLAAGVDVDTSNEGARFKSMLTNALGIGHECKAATFVVPVATGDRFLLCSDGITEYLQEVEIGEILSSQPSPARAAQKLVELALARGGADNATALVVKVIEAGETARPAEQLARDTKIIASCPLWAKSTPQGQLRALRIALPREYAAGDRIPAQTLGDRVAWIVVEGEVELEHGAILGPGGLLYPEALVENRALPDKHGLGVAAKDVRVLALRADDFRELCADDTELGEQLIEALGLIFEQRGPARESTRAETVPVQSEDGYVRHTELGMAVQAEPIASTIAPTKGEPPRTKQTDPGMAATLPPLKHVAAPSLPRSVTPPRGRPSDPQMPALAPTMPSLHTLHRPTGDPAIGRSPTPPMGIPHRAPSPPLVPPPAIDDIARGPTDPHIVVPRTSTERRAPLAKPPALVKPRPQSPAAELSGAEADAQLDQVFSDLTTDNVDTKSRTTLKGPVFAEPLTAEEAATEITIEADAPPLQVRPPPSNRHTRPTIRVDDDEPEISIERYVELEVDTPMNAGYAIDDDGEPEITLTTHDSSPEVVVIQTHRPITANDAPHVAGTIDTSPKRAKRPND
jgi:PPM family protein phosphatase